MSDRRVVVWWRRSEQIMFELPKNRASPMTMTMRKTQPATSSRRALRPQRRLIAPQIGSPLQQVATPIHRNAPNHRRAKPQQSEFVFSDASLVICTQRLFFRQIQNSTHISVQRLIVKRCIERVWSRRDVSFETMRISWVHLSIIRELPTSHTFRQLRSLIASDQSQI